MSLLYKIAQTEEEFEQIHRLNYRTFAEEIPQHAKNESQRLIDKFHKENTYIICMKKEKLVGMTAVRAQRPFSLDAKIGAVEKHLPVCIQFPVEIRLLAIDPDYRHGRVFLGLMQALMRYCLQAGYDAALISGTVRELKLYKDLGFVPFAHLTGSKEASFQPLYITRENFENSGAARLLKPQVNLLPGPANIAEDVRQMMMKHSLSHRSAAFSQLLKQVKQRLLQLTGAADVQIFQGTGTLANDVVAGQLSVHGGKGLILINGEFGERLKDHAERFGLEFDVMEVPWGETFENKKIEDNLHSRQYHWLWMVHSETSTGILNDLDSIKNICELHEVVLAADTISSLGAVPVHLDKVHFASGVSGKALSSYSGLSFVFHQKPAAAHKQLPRYADLGVYEKSEGIPFTQSSHMIAALQQALQKYETPEAVYEYIAMQSMKIRKQLEANHIEIAAKGADATPAVLTLKMARRSAAQFGEFLFMNGFYAHYESAYLRERNWLQIACMNELSENEMERLLALIRVFFERNY